MSLASDFKALGEQAWRRGLAKGNQAQAAHADARAEAVLRCLAQGMSVAEAAAVIGVSERTVYRALKRKKGEA